MMDESSFGALEFELVGYFMSGEELNGNIEFGGGERIASSGD